MILCMSISNIASIIRNLTMKKIFSLPLAMILFSGILVVAQENPIGKRAMEHVRHLASNEFKGRYSGAAEYQKAAEYVAQKMKEYGLQPGGEDGTYFQQAELKNWRIHEPPIRLEILQPVETRFIPGRGMDFMPNNGTGSGIVRGKVAFAGYGLVSSAHDWDDYEGLDVKGRIVCLLPGAPGFMEKFPRSKSSAEQKVKTAMKKGAIGVIFMNVDESSPRRRSGAGIKKGVVPDGFVIMTARSRVIDRLFYLVDLSWRDLVSRTLREERSFTVIFDTEVEMEAHYIQEKRTAPNVIGIIPGLHPERKDEYILVGGHLDHLGVGPDGIVYNGADDNAASVAVILEIAKELTDTDFQPDRTLVFIGWAGEEQGLIGSRYYANNPIFPLEKTAVYMNMDMVGTGDDDLYVGGMWEFSDFFDLIKKNLRPEFKEKLRYRLDYRGSDHSAFIPKGVTSISLRTGNPLTRSLDDEHPEYHRPGDITDTIRPEILEKAAQYHLDALKFLANAKNNLLIPKHHVHFLHKNSFIADMHCDTISRFIGGDDLTKDNSEGHIDIPKLKEGAVDLQVFACYVGPPRNELQKHQAAKRVFDQIDAIHQLVDENPDDLLLLSTSEDTRKLRGTRKTGVLIGIEGGYAIENDLRLLRSFYRNGARLMTLTHWLDTDWADASGDPEANLGGLTDFGEQVIEEMNKLGMIIDVSHSHDETFWDVIRLTKDPIVASHSCSRKLSLHHRNLSDKMLKALAKNKGVIGINFAPGFLNAENSLQLNALRSELLKKYDLPEDREGFEKANDQAKEKFRQEYLTRSDELKKTLPPIDARTVVDHIEHVIKVTGNANHVGLGSDYDGIGNPPTGLEHIGKIINITAEMIRRNFKETDIRKILGGNFQRVLQKVCSSNRN